MMDLLDLIIYVCSSAPFDSSQTSLRTGAQNDLFCMIVYIYTINVFIRKFYKKNNKKISIFGYLCFRTSSKTKGNFAGLLKEVPNIRRIPFHTYHLFAFSA